MSNQPSEAQVREVQDQYDAIVQSGAKCTHCPGAGTVHDTDCTLAAINTRWSCQRCGDLVEADAQPAGEMYSAHELYVVGRTIDPARYHCAPCEHVVEGEILDGLRDEERCAFAGVAP